MIPEEREDVKATVQHGTTPDAPQQKGKWRAIDWIAGSTLVAEALLSIIWTIVWAFGCRFEHQLQVYLALVLFILTGGYLALIFCPIFRKDNDPRWFHARILSSGIVGGSYAFLLPAVMGLEEGSVTSGGAAALRQAILLATGGLIGLIALGETRRKNDNDREAAESLQKHQQDTLNQQKKQFEEQLEKQQKQFEANAFKDRKAERRERYTKAIEQLGDEKSSVRMGGVYTLVGLVDEWLEEESIRKYEDRLKEGQVIINNLCAYIRSPFTLASHYDELMQDTPGAEGVYQDKVQEFYADKATLDSEADVRLGIIKEIHDRLRGPKEETPGTWSDFEYDFSGSIFFYPVDLSDSYYLKSVNFSGSTYQNTADFSGSTYQRWANFSGSTYQGRVYFCGSTYQNTASFGGSTYLDRADFRGSTYWDEVDFGESTYLAWVDFGESTYWDEVDFGESTYLAWVYFGGSTYWDEVYFGGSTYWDWANFGESTYQSEVYFYNSTYWGWADFRGSTYQSEVYFYNSTYWGWADFGGSTYWDWANFGDSTYWDWVDFSASIHRNIAIFSHSIYKGEAYFNASIFYQETYFSEDGYNRFSLFTDCAPQFYDETNHKYTLFGSLDNNFTVENGRGYPIYRNLEGLPLGCKFLTSEWREGLEDKFQEIEETNNKLLEAKYPKEKAKLSKKLRALNEELHEWRDAITTVIVEICIISDQIIPREF